MGKASHQPPGLALPKGKVPALRRYTLCHRYEPFWMKPCAGSRLSEVPAETQFFLAELTAGGWLLYVPLIDEPWRFSLRGHPEGRLELLAETGDPNLGGLGGLAAFVALGDDPFALLERSADSVAARLGGACRLRRDKPLPEFVDGFGLTVTGHLFVPTDAAGREVRGDASPVLYLRDVHHEHHPRPEGSLLDADRTMLHSLMDGRTTVTATSDIETGA